MNNNEDKNARSLNQWVRMVHDNSLNKGFWDNYKWDLSKPTGSMSYLELTTDQKLARHALMTSEIAEATEAARTDAEGFYIGPDGKPDGEATELADAVIRIMDYFGARGWDLEDVMWKKHFYNKGRPYKHGKKI